MAAPPSPPTNLTRAYVALFAARLAAFALLGGGPGSGPVHVVLLLASVIVGLLWLHRAWSRVPEPCRVAYDGRRVQPDEAIWKLFIPVYGLYWLFIANIGLCGALEKQLKQARARSIEAPSTLALIAGLVQLVPGVNLIAPILWAVFMTKIDAAQAEAERLDPDARPFEPVRWVPIVLLVAGGIVAFCGALIVLFVGIWHFLNPGPWPPSGSSASPSATAGAAERPAP